MQDSFLSSTKEMGHSLLFRGQSLFQELLDLVDICLHISIEGQEGRVGARGQVVQVGWLSAKTARCSTWWVTWWQPSGQSAKSGLWHGCRSRELEKVLTEHGVPQKITNILREASWSCIPMVRQRTTPGDTKWVHHFHSRTVGPQFKKIPFPVKLTGLKRTLSFKKE